MTHGGGRSGGSSPRARGTPGDRRDGRRRGRLIPARAGNTPWCSGRGSWSTAHPRARGEHCNASCLLTSTYGSSPRARGTPHRRADQDLPARLIPARAGNTCSRRRTTPPTPAHPRARGEHVVCDVTLPWSLGSSPRARGTPPTRHSPSPPARLIPARAGNTRTARARVSSSPAHPRARGEHDAVPVYRLARFGSSPRARGTRC